MKKYKYYHITLSVMITWILLSSFTTNKTVPKFHSIDTEDGLVSNVIMDMEIDHKGAVWIASENGLNVAYGKTIETVKIKDTGEQERMLPALRSISNYRDDELWVGTQNSGLFIINKKSRKLVTNKSLSKIGKAKITSLFKDSKERMWIGTPYALFLYDYRTDTCICYNSIDKKRKKTYVTNIFEDSDGHIFIGTWGSTLFYFKEESESFKHLIIDNNNNARRIWSFCEDTNGNIWIGTWGDGLYKTKFTHNEELEVLSHPTITNSYFDKKSVFNIVYDLSLDDHGQLWVGTDGGLGCIYDTNSNNKEIDWLTGFNKAEQPIKDAYELLKDNEGAIWVGTKGVGIHIIDMGNEQFDFYYTQNTTERSYSNDFGTFWEFKGELYTGVWSLGFGKYNLANKHFTSYNKIPEFSNFDKYIKDLNSVTSFHQESDRYVWFTTRYQGLIRYDLHENRPYTVIRNYALSSINTTLIEKGEIWLGGPEGLLQLILLPTDKDGVVSYKEILHRSYDDNGNSFSSTNVSDIIRGADHSLWVSFRNRGLYKIIDNNENPFEISFEAKELYFDGKSFNDVQSMYQDSKGQLWLSTINDGLIVYSTKEEKIIKHLNSNKLWSNRVISIIEDNDHNIWASTNKGIIKIKELNNHEEVIKYSVSDESQCNVYIPRAVYKDSIGNLYFGGHNGFNRFNPSDLKYTEYNAPIIIDEISVDQKTRSVNYEDGEALRLTYKNNSFSISFSSLSYTQSNNSLFKYKLDGIDNKWIDAGKGINKVMYGKLPAGDYLFKVLVANKNGVWSKTPLSLPIKVTESPFKTTLAYIIYLLIFLGITLGGFLVWRRDLLLKQAYVAGEMERSKLEKINEFKLKFFTNISHELLTPLSIITNVVEQAVTSNKEDKAYQLSLISRNAKRLTYLINQLLDFRKVETGNKKLAVAETEIDNLIHNIDDSFSALCNKKKISYNTIGLINKLIIIDIDKLDKILHNLLSNAFKYTPNKGKITLKYELEIQEDIEWLCVEVIDSGNGIPEKYIGQIFDRFYQIESETKGIGSGIGLSFTQALIEVHKGKIDVRNNETDGSTFFFRIPVSGHCYSSEDYASSKIVTHNNFSNVILHEENKTQIGKAQQVFIEQKENKILLVEDNEDMREVTKNYLSEYYEVYESENGKVALELLKTVKIDLIISDIMMPEMNGFELCKHIKDNIATSHIPIILTTAKRDQNDFIEGYKALADSYITKPVNLEMLYTRIENLIVQRKRLKKLISYENSAVPIADRANNKEKEFMDEVNKIIRDNIANQSFNIAQLYDSLNYSESVIFRKIKKTTNLSPNQYVRKLRLIYASQLLKNNLKPLECAYQSGFGDPSYFSSCFKKEFGSTPREYQKKIHN